MSYILDALRKSDQQRRRGAAPTLLPLQAETAVPRRPALFAYGVLGLVLLGAGIAIGWLRPWQPQPPAPRQVRAPAAVTAAAPTPPPRAQVENAAPAMSAVVATAPAPALVPTAVPAASAPEPVAAPTPAPPAPAPPTMPAMAPATAPARALAPAQQTADLRRESRSAQAAAVAEVGNKTALPERAGPASAIAAAAPPVMAMSDLPLAIQQELPPMSISVHAFSAKTAERLVGINNRLLHEGDEVAPGLKLEQITPSGMVLSYKGYSFRRGLH